MKKIVPLILILLLFTGCSAGDEIEDVSIVMGAGVDAAENGNLELTVEIVNTNKEQEAKGEIYSFTGKTLTEAANGLVTLTGRPLYWDHMKLVVVSKEGLEKHTDELVNWIMRSKQSRISVPISLCKGNAKDLMSTEQIDQPFISNLIYEIETQSREAGLCIFMPTYILYNQLNSKSGIGIIPYLEKEDESIKVNGSAVITNKGVADKLSSEECGLLLMLKSNLGEAEISNDEFSARVTDAKTKLSINGESFFYDVTLEVSLQESPHLRVDENKAKKAITDYCNNTFNSIAFNNQDILFEKNKLYRLGKPYGSATHTANFTVKINDYGQAGTK